MEYRIADTFIDSLAKLTNEEQKIVRNTSFELMVNSTSPSMKFHKLAKSKDPNFWSIRVSNEIRLIVHKTGASLLLCYVDHHDAAYTWAERRKIETHPRTGAAQIVEIRKTVQEITIPKYVERELTRPPLFFGISENTLLGYGVPDEWLDDVKNADEDSLLELVEHLPHEAAEALLDLATGASPSVTHLEKFTEASVDFDLDDLTSVERTAQAAQEINFCLSMDESVEFAQSIGAPDPFDHPDAQRRFRTIHDLEELKRALDYPWEKWVIFLHPTQRQIVKKDYQGPARVSGSAGTGKTIVALHRAVHLARTNSDARVLLTTFSETLSNALRTKLRRLISNEPRIGERLEIHAIQTIGRRLYELNFGLPKLATPHEIMDLLREATAEIKGSNFSLPFLRTEWEEVVDEWQLRTWDEYRDVKRLGRKTRLPESKRAVLWSIFERVRSNINARGLITPPEMFTQLASKLIQSQYTPFDFAVVDEAQDISVAQLKFLSALAGNRPNGLFFAGDLGQRIFQTPFSWKALGVDIRGRSSTLRINYRTSHQIRAQADRLLAPEITDIDGNRENRRSTISVFNGPPPTIAVFSSQEEEKEAVGKWLNGCKDEGLAPHEIGVFVRSEGELGRAYSAVSITGLPCKVLDENVETTSGHASISTMHLAKGLEFKAVVVMACDDEIIPLQDRIEKVADEKDLEEVYNTERHLLYVACTRARDHLLVTSVDPASEFLDDLLEK